MLVFLIIFFRYESSNVQKVIEKPESLEVHQSSLKVEEARDVRKSSKVDPEVTPATTLAAQEITEKKVTPKIEPTLQGRLFLISLQNLYKLFKLSRWLEFSFSFDSKKTFEKTPSPSNFGRTGNFENH